MASSVPGLKSPSLISTSLVVTSAVFVVLATGAVALRFYARKTKNLKLQWDDWTILISLFMCWVYTINTLVAAGLGGFNETSLDPLKAAKIFLRCLWIEGFPLGIGLATIKISILLFYRRIFITKVFCRCIDFMIVVLIAWAISTVLCQVFAADPIRGAWNPIAPKLRYNYNAFVLAVAGMSIVFDVMVLCFPFPMIRNLQMPTRRKFSVAGIFWLGGFCCIAAAVRFYFLYQGVKVLPTVNGNPYAKTTNEFIWAHIEPNCSIIAACLPTYGTLFSGAHIFDGLIHSLRSFMSLGSRSNKSSRFRASNDTSGRDGAGSSSGLAMDSKMNGHWQKLGRSDLGDEGNHSVEIAGGTETDHDDLEAQQARGTPMKIAVTTGFGTNYREAC